MTTITSASLGELLKRLYAPWEIEQLLNLTYPLLNRLLAKGSAQLGGSGFYFPVRTKSAEGHAFISETQDLPAGRQSTVKQAVVSPVIQVGVVELSGLSKSISSGDAMSFARGFDENVQATTESMWAYREGTAFRDGSGILATFNGDPGATAGPHAVSDVGFFREGMFVDIIDVADDTRHATGIEVVDVDWVAKTVTFGAALAAAVDNGDEIYITGSQAASGAPVNKEPIGLEGSLLTSGSYLGIDRSVDTNWKANAFAVNGLWDESTIMRARTRLTQESGIPAGAISSRMKVACHPMQVDTLFKLAMSRIQYSGNSFDLGYSDEGEVSFGRLKFCTSYQCPVDKAYLGDWMYSQTVYAPGGELHIDTEYNGAPLKWVANKDVGLVFLKSYFAYINKRPNAFVRLTGLSEASR